MLSTDNFENICQILTLPENIGKNDAKTIQKKDLETMQKRSKKTT